MLLFNFIPFILMQLSQINNSFIRATFPFNAFLIAFHCKWLTLYMKLEASIFFLYFSLKKKERTCKRKEKEMMNFIIKMKNINLIKWRKIIFRFSEEKIELAIYFLNENLIEAWMQALMAMSERERLFVKFGTSLSWVRMK